MNHKRKKKSHLQEYSKRCIAAMIILWFLIALFATGVIIYQLLHTYSPEYVTLDSLLNYVGVPMTGGIVGYLIKAGVENKQKIKTNISAGTTEVNEDSTVTKG